MRAVRFKSFKERDPDNSYQRRTGNKIGLNFVLQEIIKRKQAKTG